MAPHKSHVERHQSSRAGWLRALVLGSTDAIVSTSSLMIGVAASAAERSAVLVAGVAGLAAGAMSMAVGEFVSVSAQRDAERADIAQEKAELASQPQSELRELALIYEGRGLEPELAARVAEQLSAKNRLAAHLRDELGLESEDLARPLQAAGISAVGFACFALIPILALLVAPANLRAPWIAGLSLVSLGLLGGVGARLGGAAALPAALRVTLGGGLAMLVTALIGRVFGVVAG
ncbi:MAG: VIT1/CCC1 transporter family protein [Myxococcales bacterium]